MEDQVPAREGNDPASEGGNEAGEGRKEEVGGVQVKRVRYDPTLVTLPAGERQVPRK